MMQRMGLSFVIIISALMMVTGMAGAQTEEDLLAVHQEMKQAINAQDPDGIIAVWADDCVYDYAALPQPLVGKEQIRQFFADLFTGFPDFHVEQRQILVSDNIIVTECSTTGTNLGEWMGIPPSGTGPNPHIHMDIYEFGGTKIKKITTYIDMSTIMINLGVMPVPEMPEFVPSFTLRTPEPSTISPQQTASEMAATWNNHDMVEYSKYFDPEADILVAALGTPMNPPAFFASQEMYMMAIPDLHLDIVRSLDMGNGWVVEEHIYSGHQMGPYFGLGPSGRHIAIRGGVVYHFEDGLVNHMYMYWDQISTLTQLEAVAGPVPPGLPHIPDRFVTDVINSPSLQGNAQQDPWLRNIVIYLPPSYDQGGNFPVIYLLHGYGGNEGAYLDANHPYWVEEPDFPENGFGAMLDELIASGNMKEVIVVMPDGYSKYGGSIFTNSELNGNYEDYIVQDLVNHIDSNYRTIANRDNRAIAGHSMGGYGAMKLAMKHPDIFGAVACHSGPLYLEFVKGLIPACIAENPEGMMRPALDKPVTSFAYGFAAAFSPNLQNPPFFVDLPFKYPSGDIIDEVWNKWLEHDTATMLETYVGNLSSLRGVYFDCGDQDELGIFHHAQAFDQVLSFRGVGHEFATYTGRHYTNVFSRLAVSLPYLTNALISDALPDSPDVLRANVQGLEDAQNSQDMDGIKSFCTSDVVYDCVPIPPPMHGVDAFVEFCSGIFHAFPDFHITRPLVLDYGNIVVTENVLTGTQHGEWMGFPATRKPAQITKIEIFEYEGDKIKRINVYYDLVSVMVQLGLMPSTELPPLEPSFTLPVPEPTGLSPVEAVKEMQRRWNAHDLVADTKMHHPDADIFVGPIGTSLDNEGYVGLMEAYFRAFPDIQVQPIRYVDMEEGWVLCECVWNGTHKGLYFGVPATGRPVSVRGAILYRINEEGLMTVFHTYFDSITALMQMGAVPPPGPPPTPPIPERLVVDEITSPSLEGNPLDDPATRPLLVYLPPSYTNSPNKRYQTVYLLHGFGGDHTYFTSAGGPSVLAQALGNMDLGVEIGNIADGLNATDQIQEMIIVMPNAINTYGGSWYERSELIGDYRTYIAHDLVSYIDGKYRTISNRENRGICGHSMGGYGALSLAMEYPDIFGAVAALSPGIPNDLELSPTLVDVFVSQSPDTLRPPVTGTTREDLWKMFFAGMDINEFYSLAAAYTPNLDKEPFHVDLPIQYPEKTIVPDVWQKWIEHDLVHQINKNGSNLTDTPIYIDEGVGPVVLLPEVKGIPSILAALDTKNIQYTYEEFFGDHLTHLAMQVSNALGFLSNTLSEEPVSIRKWDIHR